MKNDDWHVEVKEKEFHGKPEGKWYIMGWYEDEKTAYYAAEAAWEQKQRECWNKSPDVLVVVDGDNTVNLDIVDDYFHWNVVTPNWYLHKDGTWNKLLCKNDSFGHDCCGLLPGEYPSKELAEASLCEATPPPRMENYQDHLQNAPEPWVCKENNGN